jgi:Flp pilus assembly secretin CpaC
VVPNVGVTETATATSRVVGLTGSFTPTVKGDNRILVEYELNIEELISMQSFPVTGGSLQRPMTSVESLPGQAYVRDGQPLVLFAFDKSRDTASSAASVGGASKAGRNERQMLVIVIQVFGGQKNV